MRKRRLSKNFVAWSAVVSFVTACVLFVCLVKYSRDKKTRDLKTATAAEKPPGTFDQLLGKQANNSVPDLESDHATCIVNQALANRDTNQIRDFFILEGDDTPEQAMKELIRINDTEGNISRIEWTRLKYANEGNVPQVMIYATKEGKRHLRTAQFVKSTDRRLRIDFSCVSQEMYTTAFGGSSSRIRHIPSQGLRGSRSLLLRNLFRRNEVEGLCIDLAGHHRNPVCLRETRIQTRLCTQADH